MGVFEREVVATRSLLKLNVKSQEAIQKVSSESSLDLRLNFKGAADLKHHLHVS